VADPPAAWWARFPEGEPGPSARRHWVAVLSDEFPAGTVVDLPGGSRPSRWLLAVLADIGGERVHRVEVRTAGAPLLWYVELPDPGAAPAAATLLAFSDPRHPEGTVLTADRARADGVSSGEQVAALRWWTASGVVHQLYVAPAQRRRGVATKLSHVAYGLQMARGLPPLHGDGRRTDDGERWRRGVPAYAAARMAPWSQRLPSMTPGEA
jgi:GNAT superfamily N-acetyltransferase